VVLGVLKKCRSRAKFPLKKGEIFNGRRRFLLKANSQRKKKEKERFDAFKKAEVEKKKGKIRHQPQTS